MSVALEPLIMGVTFLPYSRMAEPAASARAAYATAKPFPHIVFDNFFDPKILDAVLSEFPKPRDIEWEKFDNEREVKLASSAESTFGPITRMFMYHLNSLAFLNFLSEVTGIENLLPDPSFDGGGLHQIQRGGKLAIHADFNKHPRYGLDRRLNVLLYLNKDWKDEYGGHLELWDRNMRGCEARILPVFNRLMIFGTTDFTYHGHPDPLRCPVGMTRKSLALYYFTNGRPAEETSGEHSTVFRARVNEEFKPRPMQRMRAIAKEVLPPVLSRRLRKYL